MVPLFTVNEITAPCWVSAELLLTEEMLQHSILQLHQSHPVGGTIPQHCITHRVCGTCWCIFLIWKTLIRFGFSSYCSSSLGRFWTVDGSHSSEGSSFGAAFRAYQGSCTLQVGKRYLTNGSIGEQCFFRRLAHAQPPLDILAPCQILCCLEELKHCAAGQSSSQYMHCINCALHMLYSWPTFTTH